MKSICHVLLECGLARLEFTMLQFDLFGLEELISLYMTLEKVCQLGCYLCTAEIELVAGLNPEKLQKRLSSEWTLIESLTVYSMGSFCRNALIH